MGPRRWGLVGLLSLSLVVSSHAQVTPAQVPPAPYALAPDSGRSVPKADRSVPKADSWHGLGMASVTAVFTVLSVIAGFAVSAAQCEHDELCAVGASAVLGPIVGMGLGPLVYDDLIGDGAGSLASAYGGMVVGIAGMVILALATEGEGLVIGVFMPFAGAGLGYSLYAPHDARDDRFKPSLNVQSEPGGGRRVTASLGFTF